MNLTDRLIGDCALRRSLRLLCMQRRCMRGRPVPERVWWSVCGNLHMSYRKLQQYGRQAEWLPAFEKKPCTSDA